MSVSYALDGDIAIITVDNPPVNALSQAIRQGIWDQIATFREDAAARAAVLICAGRTFIAGADITEFGKPILDPQLADLVEFIEACDKVVVAAIHGTALGGGLETALGCHYRCAVASAKLGLPEVLLGLLPGAQGTQRLPRLTGVEKALEMMVSGTPLPAPAAHAAGLVDEIIEGDLLAGALAYARRLVAGSAPPRRIRDMSVDTSTLSADFFADYRKSMAKKTRGFLAPERIVQAVEAATTLPLSKGAERERELFQELRDSTHSKSQVHLFFSERAVAKIPDVPKDTAKREIKQIAVIGAGTMGGGIAMNFANAGIPVTLLEVDQQALDRGLGVVRKNYENSAKRGRLKQAQVEQRLGLITPTTEYADLASADLVIEAVFENMVIKKEVFAELDRVAKPSAILASNTSTLSIDEIAATTTRAQDVIGLHFFSPANVMVLLEIVRGAKTDKDVIATCMAMAKSIRKTGVLVGNCWGFVGNRMFEPYIAENQMMQLEGAMPARIDEVVYEWGMAMGPNAVSDLAGVDVGAKVRLERTDLPDDPTYCRVGDLLYQAGRYGQKTGKGFYHYDGRTPTPDPEVEEMIRVEAQRLGVAGREISDEEIVERLMLRLINEGAAILEEGMALRASDIDVIYATGYGFPRYRGGPMFYADTIGLDKVLAGIEKYRQRYGDQYWTPAPLLKRLISEGKTFSQYVVGT